MPGTAWGHATLDRMPPRVLAAVLAGALAVVSAGGAGGVAAARADDGRSHAGLDPRRIVELTNASRRAEGVAPLRVDEQLTAAARAKLFDMLKGDYFAHRSPDGRQPWAFMQAAGYRFLAAAENLAKGYDSEIELQADWMRSRGHRANILNPRFTEIGIADAQGIVVVMFARPARR
jgi:uncharacterized protein YkwD